MRWLALAVLLCGCSADEQPVRIPAKPQVAADVQPVSRTFRFGEAGELLMLELPVQAGKRVEFQRCFVWRSQRGDTMQCPGEADSLPIPEPDSQSAAERY